MLHSRSREPMTATMSRSVSSARIGRRWCPYGTSTRVGWRKSAGSQPDGEDGSGVAVGLVGGDDMGRPSRWCGVVSGRSGVLMGEAAERRDAAAGVGLDGAGRAAEDGRGLGDAELLVVAQGDGGALLRRELQDEVPETARRVGERDGVAVRSGFRWVGRGDLVAPP